MAAHMAAQKAVDETVILLYPPLPLAGISTETERECEQNDSLADGQAHENNPAAEFPPAAGASASLPPPLGALGIVMVPVSWLCSTLLRCALTLRPFLHFVSVFHVFMSPCFMSPCLRYLRPCLRVSCLRVSRVSHVSISPSSMSPYPYPFSVSKIRLSVLWGR